MKRTITWSSFIKSIQYILQSHAEQIHPSLGHRKGMIT